MAEWASERALYLDNLKVLLIGAIIAIHGVLGYVGLDELWSYADVQETTLAPAVEAALFVVVGPFGLLLIPLLFLTAGLLTPRSLERKGPARFARDRLLRLGVPLAFFTLVMQPLALYALYHPLGRAPGSYWYEFLGAERQLDTGPLWFVGVLLILSLGYAGWAALGHRRSRRPVRAPVGARGLLLLAAAAVPPTFLIRLVYPFGSDSGFTDLNLWQWPSCIALFALGITAARQGWLVAVPDRLRRQSRAATFAAVTVLSVFVTATIAAGGSEEEFWGGWGWPALGWAAIEVTLGVFGAVWLLAEAQRHLDRRVPAVGARIRRSAYAAFIVQVPVLIGLAVTLRPTGLPAELKALIVGAAGVLGSFALAWLLIRRVPGIARVL